MNLTNKKSPKPVAAQLKSRVPVQSVKRPVAPPVYRPQAVPKVLQTKRAPGQSPKGQAPRQPVAPPVYKPEAKRIVQLKIAQTKPPVFQPRANSGRLVAPVVTAAKGIIQRVRVTVPAGVVLTGGNGVSVIWKKGQQDLPHVTIAHGPKDAQDQINVTNIHYKANLLTYFHWDDNGTTTLPFRGGAPSKKIYDRTQQQAARFGLTLQKPQSVVTEEAALAQQAQQRQEQLRQEAEAERLRQQAAVAAEEAELRWEQQRAGREGKQAEQVQAPVDDDWEVAAAKLGIN